VSVEGDEGVLDVHMLVYLQPESGVGIYPYLAPPISKAFRQV